MYEGHRKIKKNVTLGFNRYRKYQGGIENIRKVSEMTEGYWKYTKGIEKLRKRNTGFQ